MVNDFWKSNFGNIFYEKAILEKCIFEGVISKISFLSEQVSKCILKTYLLLIEKATWDKYFEIVFIERAIFRVRFLEQLFLKMYFLKAQFWKYF